MERTDGDRNSHVLVNIIAPYPFHHLLGVEKAIYWLTTVYIYHSKSTCFSTWWFMALFIKKNIRSAHQYRVWKKKWQSDEVQV